MTQVKKVDQRVKTTLENTVKYQILTYCFFNEIRINDSDLSLLTELALCGNTEVPKFCKILTDKNIFKSLQSARNAISKAHKKDLVDKDSQKKIFLNRSINVQSKGLVLLDYKILGQKQESLEEEELRRMDIIGRNGNTGEHYENENNI